VHYLLLYVLFMLAFSQTLRYAQLRGEGVLAVSAVNYVVAAVLSVAIFVVSGPTAPSERAIAAGLGATTGVLFFLNLLIMLACYRRAGVGITVALMGMGVVLPVVASNVCWGEAMTPARWVAVGLLPAAVVLMRPVNGLHRRITLRGDILLVLAFVAPGVTGILHRAVREYAPESGRELYQAALFVAAAITSVAYASWHRTRCSRRTVGLGTFLGAVNVAATRFVLLGLWAIPAVIFYPVSGSLVIAGSVIVSWLLWRERVTKRQVLGLFFAICIVVLTRL